MDFTEIFKSLGNYGAMGVVAGILFWQMSKLHDKLIEIIENNTKAFIELKNVIDKCQVIHDKND